MRARGAVLALQASVERYQRRMAEYARVEQILQGSLQALAALQEYTHRELYARASRAREHLRFVTAGRGRKGRWETEMAALLSQLGYTTLAPAQLQKLQDGHELSVDEHPLVDPVPIAAAQRLAAISGTEPVRRILAYQGKSYDGRGVPRDKVRGKGIPWGARALKIALDSDRPVRGPPERGQRRSRCARLRARAARPVRRVRPARHSPRQLASGLEAFGRKVTGPATRPRPSRLGMGSGARLQRGLLSPGAHRLQQAAPVLGLSADRTDRGRTAP